MLYSVIATIRIKLISPTIIALSSNNTEMHYLNSRRNGGRGCQSPNSRWCFSTYEKACIEDFRRKASISAGRVPQPVSPQWRQN